MSSNQLFIQNFRTNDLKDHSGSQIEFGRAWLEFLEIEDTQSDATISLLFKSLNKTHENLNNKEIELKLAEVTARGDRKTYANGSKSGHSALKEFFLYDLRLTPENNAGDYFAFYKVSELNYYLYYIPKLLHDNFVKFFETTTPKVTINRSSDIRSDYPKPLQQIFYGAPGTGKSDTIYETTKDLPQENVYRTTFHPDSDYSTFVGCYKPIMKRQYRYDGKVKAKYYEDDDLAEAKKDDIIIDKVIQYNFIPQAFTNAYIKAWQTEQPVFLVIEEINRGNCAQIFGDLFQLLDRDVNGYSKYPIDADTDLKNYLAEKFAESCREDIKDEIKKGYKLKLPNNLYIWATMNTSDQSLFPIDSAFKRRWDWKYIKIKKGIDKETKKELDWKIKVGENDYDWWEFLKAINYKIDKMTSSADKQLGYFFCLADRNGDISADTFVNKVAFYLWNDVFKDYAEDGSPLLKYKKKEDDKSESDLTFPDFFDESGNIDHNVVEQFIGKVLADDNTNNQAE